MENDSTISFVSGCLMAVKGERDEQMAQKNGSLSACAGAGVSGVQRTGNGGGSE